MRNTIITSLNSVAIHRVMDCVAAAGNIVRTILGLTFMRERFGAWRQPCPADHLGHAAYRAVRQGVTPSSSLLGLVRRLPVVVPVSVAPVAVAASRAARLDVVSKR